MGQYGDDNLIKYEDTVQLHSDTTGKMAWLILKNYGVVFHMFPWASDRWSEVVEITIGIPQAPIVPAPQLGVRLFNRPVHIGAMLDAFDVIKLQILLLQGSPNYFQGGKVWVDKREVNAERLPLGLETVCKLVEGALVGMGCKQPQGPYAPDEWLAKRFPKSGRSGSGRLIYTQSRLHPMLTRPPDDPHSPPALRPPPGAPWISEQIQNSRHAGFTAYFPYPRFILEEQRTKLKSAWEGKPPGVTDNQDTRLIAPIPFVRSETFALKRAGEDPLNFGSVFDKLDKLRKDNEEEFLRDTPLTEEQQKELQRENFDNLAKCLHNEIDRISCYGFRGDDRDLAAIKAAGGFLPGFTRKDDLMKPDQKITGEKIDEILADGMRATIAKIQAGEELKDDDDYWKAIRSLGVLTLTVYTLNQDFKGFISTTTSTAIAKCFANYWAKSDDPFRPTYCYAMRCKGGFHLPTDVKGAAKWNKSKHAKNVFTHDAEQEVAVPGAIWWDNVVGMRKVRVDSTGQYFSGPVFLCDLLRKEFIDRLREAQKRPIWLPAPDNGAFDELFELFSGKNQGMGPYIEWSYKKDAPPFDCPPILMQERGELRGAAASPEKLPATQ